MNQPELCKRLFATLEQLYPQMVEWRRHFHMHPELSFQEEKTPQKIAEILNEIGLEVRSNVGGRGVVGLLKGGKTGKTIALRADFDALPIHDLKNVPYKSKVPGVMHACGHDAHTATLLAVATCLQQVQNELPGNVVFIYQFAEEVIPGGAKPMIEDGCLDGVDVIFGNHFSSAIDVGKIGYRSEHTLAAMDRFEIQVIGQGGHGASPQHSIDSIVIGGQISQQLQQIVSRRISPIEPAVITIGTFQAGSAYNVIAETAELSGTVRSFDAQVRDQIEAEMEQVVQSACAAFGATYKFNYIRGYPPVYNHPAETHFLIDTARSIVGRDNITELKRSMGGDDFAYYVQKVPGCLFYTGSRNEAKQTIHPHHSALFDIDEEAMLIAAQTLTANAIRYLEEHK